MSDLQNLKEILAKTNPSLSDVENATMQALDDVCASFLKSRVIRQALVVQSVVKAAQQYCGMIIGDWPDSSFVKKVTLKNLENITPTLSKAWPSLKAIDVLVAVKNGATRWVEKIVEENK